MIDKWMERNIEGRKKGESEEKKEGRKKNFSFKGNVPPFPLEITNLDNSQRNL